jgi:uncharacterized membrane protein
MDLHWHKKSLEHWLEYFIILAIFYMTVQKLWKILWITSVVAMIAQVLIFGPDLPDRMASHFDLNGNPDGWSSKSTFLILWIFLIIIINIWMPLTGIIIKKGPRWMISIPNKDYWFKSEQNIARLREIMDTVMGMIFFSVNLIFIYAFHYTYEINMNKTTSLEFWPIFIPIVFVTIFPLIYLLKKLQIPSGSI